MATRMIKAILIDPFECTITEIERDASEIDNIYPLLSHETQRVTTFTTASSPSLASGDALYVDDDGMLGQPERFFTIPGCHQPFAGKGLICGSDSRGRTVDAQTRLEYLDLTTFFFHAHRNLGVHDEVVVIPTVEPWVKSNERA